MDDEFVLPKSEPSTIAEEFKVELLACPQLVKLVNIININQENYMKIGSIIATDFSNIDWAQSIPNPDIDVYLGINSNNKYSVYIEAPPEHIKKLSPWRGMKSYMYSELLFEFESTNASFIKFFDKKLFINTRNISNSGIIITWKRESDQLVLTFLFDLKFSFKSLYDSHKHIASLCKNRTPYLLNAIYEYSDANLMNLPWIDIGNDDFQELDIDFTNFFKLLENESLMYNNNSMVNWMNININENMLKCKLMEYQKQTIRWMINRESSPHLIYEDLFNTFEFSSPKGTLYYYPRFGVYAKSNEVNYDNLKISGGILADEMGLGKTVEVIGLIVSRPKFDFNTEQPQSSTSAQIKLEIDLDEYGSCSKDISKIYEEARKADKKLGSTVIYTPTDKHSAHMQTLIDCTICQTCCVAEKCNWDMGFEADFVCPQCMEEQQPLDIKSTLVIVPESLVQQWYDEISKHAANELNVMFYFGLNKSGYVHPRKLASYDIVLTTYSTLKNELDYCNLTSGYHRRLRLGEHSHKFSPSSLTHVIWWRLIVDESQLIESATKKLSKMCSRMSSCSYWCVTGTPLVKKVSDIHGLLSFLCVWPLNIEEFWNSFIYQEYKTFLNRHLQSRKDETLDGCVLMQILAQCMRRNTKKSVRNELKLPCVNVETRRVRFTAIEERQYQEVMEKMRAAVEKALGKASDDVALSSIGSREKVMMALSRLKETLISCGEHLNFKKYASNRFQEQIVFGLDTVMLRLIRNKKTEIQETIRVLLAAYFGSAGVNILKQDYEAAASKYEECSKLCQKLDEINGLIYNSLGVKGEDYEDIESDYEDNEDDMCLSYRNGKMCNVKQKRIERKQMLESSMKHLNNLRKSLTEEESRKRKLEEEQEDGETPPTKIEKEDEEKRQIQIKQKMERCAMKPIRIDETMNVHFIMNVYQIAMDHLSPSNGTKLLETVGGVDKLADNYLNSIRRYCKFELNSLMLIQSGWNGLLDEWKNADDYTQAMEYMESMKVEDGNESLVSRVQKSVDFEKTIQMMPICPVYIQNNLHVGYYKNEHPDARMIRLKKEGLSHDTAKCSGNCGCFELKNIYKNVEKATTSQMIGNIMEQMENCENIRLHVFEMFNQLVDILLKTTRKEFVELAESERTKVVNGFHEKIEQMKACKEHKWTKKKNKILESDKARNADCLICSLFANICYLEFQTGLGSFHGDARKQSSIYLFMKLVTKFERRMNDSAAALQPMKQLKMYFERIKNSTAMILSSITVFMELIYRLVELDQAAVRMSMEQLVTSANLKVERKLNVPEDAEIIFSMNEMVLINTIAEYEGLLESGTRDIRYLAFLMRNERFGGCDNEMNMCPICNLTIDTLAVFTCGHRICDPCYEMLKIQNISSNKSKVYCVTCRKPTNVKNIMIARVKIEMDSVIPGVTLAVKLESTIKLIREILEKDDYNKIILFTTFDTGTLIWNFICQILLKANVPFIELTRRNFGKKVFEIEFGGNEHRVILSSLSMCANGLNLTKANSIIFLDPTHLNSVVAQAIGRINRYGQTRDMYVYHMLVESSIDEELRRIATESDFQKERRGWTVGDIRQMFGIC